MFKKILIFSLLLCIPKLTMAAAPEITADAAVILDRSSHTILYERNGNKKEYPASLTKMLTGILSIEKINPGKVLQISNSAAQVESTYLTGGEWISAEDLTYQMLLASDNGAATALGEAMAGNQFENLLNEKAKEIGAADTHFTNASGLPDPDHTTTALDLAKIADYAMDNKIFRRIVSTKEKKVRYIRPQQVLTFSNTNVLLWRNENITGIKTGYTRAAQGCLAASETRNGRELIVIVLHSRDGSSRFEEAQKLLDYGFTLPNKQNLDLPKKNKQEKKKILPSQSA